MEVQHSSKRRLGEPKPRPVNRADRVYAELKEQIFNFSLLPGDRFSENEVAERMDVSRTPVRDALYRLQQEGYVEVYFRSGWQVRPFDFNYFEELYDVRIVLEEAAIRRLCDGLLQGPELEQLKQTWLVEEAERLADGQLVSQLDEQFHCLLVAACGNREMATLHRGVSERIRIIRRLDFTQGPRIAATYIEHGAILGAVLKRRSEEALRLLKSHIEASKAEVRKITLHMLHAARERTQRQESSSIASPLITTIPTTTSA
jgi:DNA-binding GntR family transcriptional regulator